MSFPVDEKRNFGISPIKPNLYSALFSTDIPRIALGPAARKSFVRFSKLLGGVNKKEIPSADQRYKRKLAIISAAQAIARASEKVMYGGRIPSKIPIPLLPLRA